MSVSFFSWWFLHLLLFFQIPNDVLTDDFTKMKWFRNLTSSLLKFCSLFLSINGAQNYSDFSQLCKWNNGKVKNKKVVFSGLVVPENKNWWTSSRPSPGLMRGSFTNAAFCWKPGNLAGLCWTSPNTRWAGGFSLHWRSDRIRSSRLILMPS